MLYHRLAQTATLLAGSLIPALTAVHAEPPEAEGMPPAVRARVDAIKPLPLVAIPDDPPPHEGALFDLPIVIEPPDSLLVEVLQALPDRPISGERLVRPDGTITLGFYGSVHVRGLTLPQCKAKVVEHLRAYLSDEMLGLTGPVLPDIPPFDLGNAFDLPPAPQVNAEGLGKALAGIPEQQKPGGAQPAQTELKPAGVANLAPEERVFVDVAKYNSKFYYLEGDVAKPDKLPCTGNETVLDGLQYAGGLIQAADPDNIKLVRPARGGRPVKVYPIDLKAIMEEGDALHNYQLFPGDRLVIGRRPSVKASSELFWVNSAGQSLAQSLSQMTATVRTFLEATPLRNRDDRRALFNDMLGDMMQAAEKSGSPFPDATRYRERMLRLLDAANPPSPSTPKE